MIMIIIISTLITLVVHQQGVVTIHLPIGPTFISTISTKQKIYYNNLGTTLDCSANGNPPSVLTWFRTNNSNDRPSTLVQPSELIDIYENGSLFIRPFRDYSKAVHAGTFICRAENAAGSIQTTPIQLRPQIYDTYEIEVKNPYGFEQSSAVLSCEISPPSASSYVNIVGWLEKVNNQIIQLDLRPRTKYNLLSNKNLIIHNLIKSDDNRSYACIVNNQIDNNTKQSQFKSLRVRDRSPFGPELSIPNNTEYLAQVDDLIELPCGIASLSTHARISWWKSGIEINGLEEKLYNNSLILQLSSLDSGHYVCRIDDESIGPITSMISLKVNLSIKCEMNIQQTNINAGSNTELVCTINSIKNIPIQWQWYHNSVQISTNNNRYAIINATRQHIGMYQCCYISSSSDLNNCCAQTQIRIINSPPFLLADQQTPSNIIIIPSKNVPHLPIDLNCTIYGDPIPEINIFKDGQRLSSDNRIEYLPSGDTFLHYPIHISTINDTGLYECFAKNSFGSTSLSKHINIEGQKPFIQPLSNLTIPTGKQFTLACYASGQPNLHLQWIDATNNRIVNTSSTSPILFSSINTKSNIYACQAMNSYGEISSRLFLTIEIPAKILSVTSNQTIKINEKLNIYCLAEGDNQLELRLKTHVLKQLNTIETQYENKKNVSLIIENIQMSDSGFYECYAKNNYSEDHSVFEIIVQNVPDRIENIFIENSERIFWMKPFDGNTKILKYILRIQFKQDLSWSNETMIMINNSDTTSYLFENLFSKCTISITIEAVNIIGSSIPSDSIHFETDIKPLQTAPFNLTVVNISSESVTLTWQYPSYQLCGNSFLEFVIEIIDQYNQTVIPTHNHHLKVLTINHLKSFVRYTFAIHAVNELGSSPQSKPLTIQMLESVPLATVMDLTATLLNSSTVEITWTFDNNDFQFLNGKFRSFTATIYENFNMSTLTTIETIDTNLLIHNLHSSSQYYISVSICNDFDCGPSSLAKNVKTPSSMFDKSRTIMHPINKPLILDCPLLTNTSDYIPYRKLDETDHQYQCGTKLFHIRYYDKPSLIDAKIHYTKSNEIGLKIFYPFEIIESLTITYKIKDESTMDELNISPPLLNVRLTNLSCGNIYEIMIYASNQAGFSLTEYLTAKTDGSVPSIIKSRNLLETISNNYIILNMTDWIIDECSIISYEIEIYSERTNRSEKSFSFKNELKEIKIDNLQSNQDYHLQIKVNSQAGENIKRISFRTAADSNPTDTNNEYIIIIIIISSFLLTIILSFIVFIIIKFCRKQTELFLQRKRKLKPVLYSSDSIKNHRLHHSTWLKSENDITVQRYTNNNRSNSLASEDSQGNINPYAVTGYTTNCKDENDHGAFRHDNKHHDCLLVSTDTRPSTTPCERYFCPIILESSISNDQNSLKRNPLIKIPEKPSLSNILSTASSSQGELLSAFTYNPSLKKMSNNDQSSSSADSGVHSSYTQSPKCPLHGFSFDRPFSINPTNPLYATYDQQFSNLRDTTTAQSSRHHHHQYSLV